MREYLGEMSGCIGCLRNALDVVNLNLFKHMAAI